jgi:Leucine-rich repeat (LRR) protein
MVTDASVRALKRLKGLTKLNLTRCSKVTNAGLVHVGKLTALTDLDLSGRWGTAPIDLGPIRALTGLTRLSLAETHLPDASLAPALHFPELRELSLEGCGCLTSLAGISGLKSLNVLHLGDCAALTDAGVRSLSGLTYLTSLTLRACGKLTDASLEAVWPLKSLTQLDVSRCMGLGSRVICQVVGGLTCLR